MIYLVYTIHIIVSIFLILVVLLQQGKGADLSVFGGGSTQTVFGARGAATFLHKMTVIGFVAFTLTTISIGLLSGSASSSVFEDAPAGVEESLFDEEEGDAAEGAASEALPEPAAEPPAQSEGATAESPGEDAPAAPATQPPADGGSGS